MNLIVLSAGDLLLASLLVLLLGVMSVRYRLEVEKQLAIAAVRTTVQLLLIGLVLKALFASSHPLFVAGIALIMLLAAGREVAARQKRRLKGFTGFAVGTGAMFVSSFTIMILTLLIVIQAKPWYAPQYAIPMLGMLLGNTMNGIALGMNALTTAVWQQRGVIEQRLLLGQTWEEVIREIQSESARTGMIPIINSMAAAGIVSLPGMMTGQILAGSPALEAVKYQILIMFLISAGTGLGTLVALRAVSRSLFDERHRLRLDQLEAPK